jgi:hypothetical protein
MRTASLTAARRMQQLLGDIMQFLGIAADDGNSSAKSNMEKLLQYCIAGSAGEVCKPAHERCSGRFQSRRP